MAQKMKTSDFSKQIRISNEAYDLLVKMAGELNVPLSALASEGLVDWLRTVGEARLEHYRDMMNISLRQWMAKSEEEA